MRFCALVLLVLSTSTTLAQQVITTQPIVSSLIPHGDVVHVITQMSDADYDGLQDEGELPAQWLVVDRATLSVRSTLTFPWGMTTAARVGLDSLTGLMMVGIGDTVWAYTTQTQQRSSTPLYVGLCNAVGYDATAGRIYISQRPSFDAPGTVTIVDATTLQQTVVPVGINPQQTVTYRNSMGTPTAVVLCEGLFGQNNGALFFIEDDGSTTSLTVGETPNHMVLDEESGLLYVVMNGEHAVKVVNMSTREVTSTWQTNTSGYDGPREISLTDDWAFVTTYSGKLLTFSRSTGVLNNTIDLTAKADPVLASNNSVWVGLTYNLGAYTATGNVAVYPMSATSVHEPAPMLTPTGTSLVLPGFVPGKSVSIRSITGGETETTAYNADLCTLNTPLLSSGTYIVSDGKQHVVVQVTK